MTVVAVQLPHHCLKPLLVISEIVELRIPVAVKRGDDFCKLLMQVVQVCSGPVAAVLAPHPEESVIKGAIQVGEMNEAVELMSHVIRGVIGQRRWVDGGLQCYWSISVQRICSVGSTKLVRKTI